MLRTTIYQKQTLFTIALCLLCTIGLWAQELDGPESIEYDFVGERYFISNDGPGQILTLDANGDLEIFAEGLTGSGPLGLEIVGDVLYVNAGSVIRYYDLNDPTIEGSIAIENAVLLNGMTSNGTDQLFVTDLSTQKIHAIDLNSLEPSELAQTSIACNGIIYDEPNNRLVVVGLGNGNGIYEYDFTSEELNLLVVPDFFLTDGIAIDPCGHFYVSTWSENTIVQFNNDFTESTTILENLSGPADLFYNIEQDILAIPNVLGDSLTFHPIETANISDLQLGDCLYDPNTDYSYNELSFTIDWNNAQSTEWNLLLADSMIVTTSQNGPINYNIDVPADGNELLISIENETLCGAQSSIQNNEDCAWTDGINEVNEKSFQVFPNFTTAQGTITIVSQSPFNQNQPTTFAKIGRAHV